MNMKENSDIFFGLFNDSFPPVLDGVTLTVQNYAQWMLAHGLAPCVVTPNAPEKPAVDYDVIRYFSLPIASRHPYRYGYPKLDFRIKGRLRQKPFALIHSHSPFSAGRLAIYAARYQSVPVIGTFHSKYRTDLEHSFRRTPWMVNIIMRRVLNFFNACDQVWIPQASVEETVREYGFRGPLHVVPNGSDMSHIPTSQLPAYKLQARRELGIPDQTISLLFVGQNINEKGIFVILDALKLLRERQVPFRMNYLGTGYALERLRSEVMRSGLGDAVKVHGLVENRDELARFYAAADLFLFPSFYDNAPLVVREAAAMFTPSILPIGSTAAEVIRDGYNGFLSERSPQAYAAAIEKLASGPALIRKAGRNARHDLIISWDDVMQQVMERYKDLIITHKR